MTAEDKQVLCIGQESGQHVGVFANQPYQECPGMMGRGMPAAVHENRQEKGKKNKHQQPKDPRLEYTTVTNAVSVKI